MSGKNDDLSIPEARDEDGSNPIDGLRATNSILKLIELMPVQEPPTDLVDSTVQRVLSEAKMEG